MMLLRIRLPDQTLGRSHMVGLASHFRLWMYLAFGVLAKSEIERVPYIISFLPHQGEEWQEL